MLGPGRTVIIVWRNTFLDISSSLSVYLCLNTGLYRKCIHHIWFLPCLVAKCLTWNLFSLLQLLILVGFKIIVQGHSTQEGKGLFQLIVTVHYDGTSEQELKAGNWTQELKHRTQRNADYWFAQFIYYRPTSPGTQPLTVSSVLLCQSSKCPLGLPTGQSNGDIFSTKGPSSQMWL